MGKLAGRVAKICHKLDDLGSSVEPLPGRLSPSASVRQFIEFAVNMPEQEPQVGQAERSMVWTSSSL